MCETYDKVTSISLKKKIKKNSCFERHDDIGAAAEVDNIIESIIPQKWKWKDDVARFRERCGRKNETG